MTQSAPNGVRERDGRGFWVRVEVLRESQNHGVSQKGTHVESYDFQSAFLVNLGRGLDAENSHFAKDIYQSPGFGRSAINSDFATMWAPP